jgi:tetratricopeptide (TPR) repeat protein
MTLRLDWMVWCLMVGSIAGCRRAQTEIAVLAGQPQGQPPATPAQGLPAPTWPLVEGLGGFSRCVTTHVPLAQRYFDQGLCFLYAFNHEAAARSFEEAARQDPQCPMAWWGMAMAHGPHINRIQVPPEWEQAALAAVRKAMALRPHASPVEQALIDAVAVRHADPPPDDRLPLDEAYAAAMQQVFARFPEDPDVGALYAEALMNLRPWDLWTADGKPQPGTERLVAVIQRVLTIAPRHPLGLHLYLHALEASPHPEQAAEAADRLRDLQPGLGHMLHMPSHIDVRLGHWAQAITANQKAIEADRRLRMLAPLQADFYQVYMAHNHHMLAYAAMMCGRSELAIRTIREMVAQIPPDWLRENAALADGFVAMPLEVLVRFSRWDEVLAAPRPPEHLPLSRAFWHAARATALVGRGLLAEARREEAVFREAAARVPEGASFGNNTAADLLAIAGHLLRGEILYAEGSVDEALAALQTASILEDGLRYSEPPDWMHPVRHVWGAILLAEGRAAEAEVVYRQDLTRQPNNGWSLYGLYQSLVQQNRPQEAQRVQAQFEAVWREADVTILSSFLCRPAP